MTDKDKDKDKWKIPMMKVLGMLKKGRIKEVEDLIRAGDIPKPSPEHGTKFGIDKSLWAA